MLFRSEIVDLCKEIGRKPDVIVTNNFEDKIPYNPGIRELDVVIHMARHDQLMDYFRMQSLYNPKDILITLHGYLRIIEPSVCTKYDMYNGHPGAIDLYPELKGKDPQERAWNDRQKYSNIGSVVHKVVEGVDEGEVVSAVNYVNRVESLDEMYCKLKESSLQSWLYFLKRRLNENRN